MTNDQLTGKYSRLRDELAAAYAEPHWSLGRTGRTGRIDRLARELADIERTWMAGRAAHSIAAPAPLAQQS